MYEVVWMRQLALIFGVTTYAVSTVLAIFMGGLAVGSFVFGRWADRVSRPLLLYALVEFGIAGYALILPILFEALRNPYIVLYRMELPHALLILSRALLGAAVLLPPTILMGGTLPILAKFLIRHYGNVGRQIGLLYFFNTAGAVAGCTLTGFYGIEHFGLLMTTRIAALANVALALIAVGVHVYANRRRTSIDKSNADEISESALSPAVARAVLFSIGLSGFVSLANEVFWTRALLRYLYNSTYAFTTMLAVFLTGLAVGSSLYIILPFRKSRPLLLFAALELGAGLGFVLSMHLFADLHTASTYVLGDRLASFDDTIQLLIVRSAMILFLPAVCFGATLPLATEIFTRRVDSAGKSVGNIYAVNTIGAIFGSLGASFVLIPVLGMQGTIVSLISLNIAIAVGLVLVGIRSPVKKSVTTLLIAFTGIASLQTLPPDVFRGTFSRFKSEIIYYHEGVTDTIGVLEMDGQRVIQFDDLRGTAATTTYPWNFVLGHLPVLLHPGEPSRGLHICFGVGNSLSAMAVSDSVQRIDSVELSPHVLDAARYFWTNNGILDNPKIRSIIDDGRNFVMATDQTYDVIELEPPETFTAGVINLYTVEFYADIRAKMAHDAIFLQWIPVGEAPLEEEKMLFRAFYDVFPYTTAWKLLSHEAPILLIGTKKPLQIDYQRLKEKLAEERVRQDLHLSQINDVDDLLALYLFGPEEMEAFVRDVQPVTDDRTVLDFSMPRFLGSGFGLGSFLVRVEKEGKSPADAAVERFDYYAQLRSPIISLLTNIGAEKPESVQRRITERGVHAAADVLRPIPEMEWNRWPKADILETQ